MKPSVISKNVIVLCIQVIIGNVTNLFLQNQNTVLLLLLLVLTMVQPWYKLYGVNIPSSIQIVASKDHIDIKAI